jgi:hypothetical protein
MIDLQGDVNWVRPNPATLINRGTLRKSAGTATSIIEAEVFENYGTLSVWQGALSVYRLSLSASSVVEFPLAGSNHPEDYGRITSSQSLPLMGRLAVSFRNGFVPGAGQQFDVIAGPIAGQLESFTVPAISSNVFMNPILLPNLVRLVTIAPTPALRGLPSLDNEGRLVLNIEGIVNQSYAVEATTNFMHWAGLETNGIPTSTLWRFVDEDRAILPYRFYRVLFLP